MDKSSFNKINELVQLVEANTPDWMLKKVKNPKTGNMVQVRSLTPKEQEKYRPKSENKFQLDKKVIKAFAKKNNLGNWTTRGTDTLLDKDSGKKYKVKSIDDVIKHMGGLPKDEKPKKDKPVKSAKNPLDGVPDSGKKAIVGMINDMQSDYDTMIKDSGEKVSEKKYWLGLAEMAVERAADEDGDLSDYMDKNPGSYDKLVKYYANQYSGGSVKESKPKKATGVNKWAASDALSELDLPAQINTRTGKTDLEISLDYKQGLSGEVYAHGDGSVTYFAGNEKSKKVVDKIFTALKSAGYDTDNAKEED